MKKLLKIFKFILFSEKQWLKPKKVDILFYDHSMSDIIKDKLSNYKYDILYLRGEKLNIYIIIKLILSFKYKNLFLNYCKLYIQFSHPKIIITAIDNNINFYKLQNQIKSIKFKTIVIQNAHRTCTAPDILNYYENFDQKNLSADFFLCFNEAIGKIYSEKFDVEYIPIGSFLNNVNFNFQTNKKNKIFFWLSQYRSRNTEKVIHEENLTFNQLKNFQNLSSEEHCLPEKTIIPLIYDFCKKKKLEFKILSTYRHDQNEIEEEKNFYENILKDRGWKMNINKKKNRLSSYEILEKDALFVAHIDSTLGYECLARKIKTLSFCCRKSFYKHEKNIFSWPVDLPQKGKIWTSELSIKEIKNMLDFIYDINDKEWEIYLNSFYQKIMENDPNPIGSL